MKKCNFYVFLVGVCLIFSSCCCQRQCGAESQKEVNICNKTVATVRDYRSLDGCKYLLELEDGRFLNPINLDLSFQNEGVKICVDFVSLRMPSVCMKGKVVELKSIIAL